MQTSSLADHLSREWLLTNGRGGFASGTPLGINTRRYHGLLCAAARPPLERWMLLSNVLEKVTIDGESIELASFQFDGAIHPHGFEYLAGFETSNNPQEPWTRFEYKLPSARVKKRVVLPRGRDEVRIEYTITASSAAAIEVEIAPFAAMRDFHHLTQAWDGFFQVDVCKAAAIVHAGPRLWMCGRNESAGHPMRFESRPDWWRRFFYREEAHRGQDCYEDLFVPGWFKTAGKGELRVVFTARALFNQPESPAISQSGVAAAALQSARREPQAADVEQRLLDAADAFVVTRRRADGRDSKTILAGYHWFGDWGRDTFIAMPGLLFETQRFDEAREILETFASVQRNGLIPNRFSDYGDGCDYNSVDASLWFLHAATRYFELTSDKGSWERALLPACRNIVEHFTKGTEFDIYVDRDGLLSAGNEHTQLTWMDAKFGDTVFTPRHGKAVEINALWYHGLKMLEKLCSAEPPPPTASGTEARRYTESPPAMEARRYTESPTGTEARRYRELAVRAEASFVQSFWNQKSKCLFDVVHASGADAAIRPNQIIAVSLCHSPLESAQQRMVLDCVREHLLTPYGLRSLSPSDPAYRPRCEGNPYERDSAYHQGTVWGWLIGPYVEAFLRVREFSAAAKKELRNFLGPLIAHLGQAGIGSVSEIFDGDPPHTPRGCIAQAWSVGELLRAWQMTA